MVEDAKYLSNIVHEPTQTEGQGVDLTVREIYEVAAPGRVDFGGGELEAAELEPHHAEKRNPDDEYEWWNLDSGTYLVEYNESVNATDITLTVQTRAELLKRGAFHPTLRITKLPRIPLTVSGAGLRIKENARVSTIIRAE